MCQTGKLFRADIPGGVLWMKYLNAFKDGTNPVFRDPQSSSHNCNHCNNFIRRYGNIVAINEDGSITTLFGNANTEKPYKIVAQTLDTFIKSKAIIDVFFETFEELKSLPYESCKKSQDKFLLGVSSNHKRYTKEEAELYGVVKSGQIKTFNHFHLNLPSQFIDNTGKSVKAIMGEYRDKYSVFKRAMEEIPLDTLNLVKDLINQGSLLDGDTYLHAIEEIIPFAEEYKTITSENACDIFCWEFTYLMDRRVAKFKNILVGVLCTELAEGKELNKACKEWNKRIDPVNFMKVTSPITKKQIAEAKRFVEENGFEASFDRRLAILDDIKVSEIKHINNGSGEIKAVSIFDDVKTTSTRHKRSEFKGLEEVPIEKFMKDILPQCTSVEALLRNSYEGNLVVLTTANKKDSKPIFKWPNNYSYTFNGNLAGKSQIKEAVKSQGGKIGVLRFSIMWAEDTVDNSDLDAHCIEPDGTRIFFSSKLSYNTDGNLDIDITQPQHHKTKDNQVVENITYPFLDKMSDGTYQFIVHQYSSRNSKGFKAEIEFGGEMYYYEYNQPVKEYVQVAKVTLKGGEFSIEHSLPETNSSKELWGLETNDFHKVNLICLSPNHWEENVVGKKHYMFMLDECTAESNIRGFHNENLIPELLKHRKVMEVLGATAMIKPTAKHLAGIGFNATVRDELIVKLTGSFKRMLKIKF